MTAKVAVIYGDEFLRYDFGPEHPFNQLRVKLAVQLMEGLDLIRPPEVALIPPPSASVEDALMFHHPGYLQFVESACAAGEGWLDIVHDTPAFSGGLEASLVIVGATIHAVDLVVGGQFDHVFNLGGGLHHAHRDRASGFCVLNDCAIGIAHLKRLGFERIMYVDVDAHHGDGVMYGFYDDPAVIDFDFHEDGKYLFPGTGHLLELGEGPGLNRKLNFPLPPYTGDSSYVFAFRELLVPFARAHRPQIIILQCGVDTHAGDPLTHMRLTNNAYVKISEIVHDLAHELCDGRLVMLGGGGYNPASVALGWTRMLATVAHVIAPITLPEPWREDFQRVTGQRPPAFLEEAATDDNRFQGVWEKVRFLKGRLGLA